MPGQQEPPGAFAWVLTPGDFELFARQDPGLAEVLFSSPPVSAGRALSCGHTKAQVVVPVVRSVPVPVGGAAVLGVVDPATAPNDPFLARAGTLGPFPHIVLTHYAESARNGQTS